MKRASPTCLCMEYVAIIMRLGLVVKGERIIRAWMLVILSIIRSSSLCKLTYHSMLLVNVGFISSLLV
jgi:hypothetical protein